MSRNTEQADGYTCHNARVRFRCGDKQIAGGRAGGGLIMIGAVKPEMLR